MCVLHSPSTQNSATVLFVTHDVSVKLKMITRQIVVNPFSARLEYLKWNRKSHVDSKNCELVSFSSLSTYTKSHVL